MTATAPALDIDECAARLGCRRHTLLAHIRAGTLTAIDITPPNPERKGSGRRTYRIEPQELERFIASMKTRPIAPPVEEDPAPKPMGRPKAGTPKAPGLLGDYANRRRKK